MPKFTISALLWTVGAFAIVLAIVITQGMLREQAEQLATANQTISTYRDELGKLDIADPEQYYIRHFKDRYTSDTEFRWRIHAPDASKCNIFYSVGELPVDGFPSSPEPLIQTPLPNEPAELVLIVESREDHLGGPGDFRIGFYPEVESGKFLPLRRTKMQAVDWMPWFRNTECVCQNPPIDSVSTIKLEKPFIIMKHFTVDDAGNQIGYMFWMESTDGSRAAR